MFGIMRPRVFVAVTFELLVHNMGAPLTWVVVGIGVVCCRMGHVLLLQVLSRRQVEGRQVGRRKAAVES